MIEAGLQEIKEVLLQKFKEDPKFIGKINFTVNCYRGGIGNIEAHSWHEIKNGKDLRKV